MKIRFVITLALTTFLSTCSAEKLTIDQDLVFVEGEEFILGKENLTSHLVRVKLDDFYISKYETTVEQWELFLEDTKIPYLWRDKYTDTRIESPYSDSPIPVHWIQAVEYLNWVSRKYGLEECYVINGEDVEWIREANGYRLLTDAEWEYAARGGNLSKGYEFSGSNDLDEVAWTGWNSANTAHPVGIKKSNELGLFDMSGNMSEWCWDLSFDYPNNLSVLLSKPIGPSKGEYLKIKDEYYRISRGGSYGTVDEFQFTPFYRTGSFEKGTGSGGLGLRLARNAPIESP
ncbi:formylglycine-generating enzyme family protein [Oceanispirochaeta crateris]|nr:SUMF1/EgtB/PvdO family nonheme iron enzyme [Oceanispirochaeta crateris]